MTTAKTSPAPTDVSPAITLARIGAVTRGNDGVSSWVDVHFNPASLQLQVSNELKDTKNNERKQYIAKTSAKLTMELLFDTTDTGADVTQITRKLQAFIAPPAPKGQQAAKQPPPPLVMFEWGRLKFKGIAESYKETIDFFSANGVPLRAAVNLTLSRQDQVFDAAPAGAPQTAGGTNDPLAIATPPASPADIAKQSDKPEAARGLGLMNGVEDLRFGDGEGLTIGGAIALKPPAAFSAGAGLDLLGAAGGLGLDALANGAAGVADLARLSAADGAFSALRAVLPTLPPVLDPARVVPTVRSAVLSTDSNASFNIGGRATTEGGAGRSADVGAGGGLAGRLTFDG